MVVLGIDPGTANTGYGVVETARGRTVALDCGVIRTRPGVAPEHRLEAIHTAVARLLDVNRVNALALEELYFGRNVSTAASVGQAVGVVLLAAGQRGIPCRTYTPQQVKGAVCGNGRADKRQVQRMVGALLGMGVPPDSDHAADALAVAICHTARAPMEATLAAAVGT